MIRNSSEDIDRKKEKACLGPMIVCAVEKEMPFRHSIEGREGGKKGEKRKRKGEHVHG